MNRPQESMNPLTHQSRMRASSLEAMDHITRQLAGQLQPGDVIALNGPLGAGKTTFSQQLGEALGLQEPVTSPTFVLIHEYLSGRIPLIHVDLYRLGKENAPAMADDLFALIDEGQALVLVEWACYGSFLNDALTLAIDIDFIPDSPDQRLLTIRSNRPLDLPQESV